MNTTSGAGSGPAGRYRSSSSGRNPSGAAYARPPKNRTSSPGEGVCAMAALLSFSESRFHRLWANVARERRPRSVRPKDFEVQAPFLRTDAGLDAGHDLRRIGGEAKTGEQLRARDPAAGVLGADQVGGEEAGHGGDLAALGGEAEHVDRGRDEPADVLVVHVAGHRRLAGGLGRAVPPAVGQRVPDQEIADRLE